MSEGLSFTLNPDLKPQCQSLGDSALVEEDREPGKDCRWATAQDPIPPDSTHALAFVLARACLQLSGGVLEGPVALRKPGKEL